MVGLQEAEAGVPGGRGVGEGERDLVDGEAGRVMGGGGFLRKHLASSQTSRYILSTDNLVLIVCFFVFLLCCT